MTAQGPSGEPSVEGSDKSLCCLDTAGCFTAVSDPLARALDRSVADLIGAPLIDMIHPDDRAAVSGQLDRLDDWVRAIHVAARVDRESPGPRWLLWTLWRHRESSGLRGSARDVTEQKGLAADASTHFEVSLSAMTIADRQSRYVRINPAFTRILGWTERDLATRGALDLIHHDDLERTRAEGSVLTRGNTPVKLESRFRCRDGSFKWIAWSSRSDADSQLFYSVGNDVTAVKETQARLLEARQMAEAASQAKSEFLANMSHELRTPLNAILGYAQILLRDEQFTAAQRERIETIHRSGEHLLMLINDILDLAKIEAGKLQLNRTVFHLGGFISAICDMIQLRVEEKGLSFIAEIDPDVPTGVLGDQTRLRQILLNLLGNAVKFTDEGTVTVRVALACSDRLDDGQVIVRFEVEDTGSGIPSDRLETIFRPFEQLRSRAAAEGTGLGLSISKQLVELMGGEIAVTSTVDRGSRFWFTTPMMLATDWREPALPDARVIIGYAGPRRTLLIADDRWTNRGILRDLLAPVGFGIMEAENGVQALDLVRRERPDLIIMDLVMPQMDGFEAVRRIRDELGLRSVPIIATSASVFHSELQDGQNTGCDDYLFKPIEASALFDRLRDLLGLTWRYRDPPPGRGSRPAEATGEHPGAAPRVGVGGLTDEGLAAMARAAEIGDIREILSVLERSGTNARSVSDGTAPGNCADLYKLARRFDAPAIRAYIASLVESAPGSSRQSDGVGDRAGADGQEAPGGPDDSIA